MHPPNDRTWDQLEDDTLFCQSEDDGELLIRGASAGCSWAYLSSPLRADVRTSASLHV